MKRPFITAVLGAALISTPAPAQQPNAAYPYVVEDRTTRWELSADGTGRVTTRTRFRIENEAGVRMLGQLLEPYLVSRSRLEVRGLTVRHRDGSVDALRREHVRDLPAPVTAAFPVYTDLHVLHITPPALRPGDVLELAMLREIVHPDAPGHFWAEHSFIRNTLVESETLEVRVPAAVPVKLRTADDLEPEIEQTGEHRLYRWTHSQDHVEAAEEQVLDPRALIERPEIELTSFAGWRSVGDWYADLALDRARPDRRVRSKATELTDGLVEDRERIAALYDFVRRNVRYLGLELGIARYQPQAAAETLVNGYGDCKDKHTLLAALLRAAGYEAWPVVVGVLREPTPEVPGPAQFDHVVTAVEVGEETLWLDSTELVNPFGYLGPAIRGKQALLVKPVGQSRLIELPESLPYPAYEKTRLAGRVDRDGTLAGTVTYEVRGDGEPTMRAALLNTAGEQRTELGKQLLAALDLEADLAELTTTDPADAREPLRVTMKIRQSDFLSPFTASQQIQLPTVAVSFPTLVEEDEDDVFLGNPAAYTVELDLTFPEGTRLEPPLPVTVEREFATLRSSFAASDNRLTGSRTLQVMASELVMKQRDAYEAFWATLRSDGEQTLGLAFAEGVLADPESIDDADRLYRAGSDAYRRDDFETAITLFEQATEIEPEHDDAWEELGRSLVEAGRSDDAVAAMRRQLEVAPHHATARSHLGWALEEAGDEEAAADAYREQLLVDPSDEYSTARLGHVLWRLGRYEESLPYLRRAARDDPDDESLMWRLADSELHAGEDTRGASLLRTLAEIEEIEVVRSALLDMASHGHPDQLDPLLERLAELAPESPSTWMMHGELARAAERHEDARAAFSRALELDPENTQARIELAAALYRLRRYADAIPHYRQYLERRPEDADSRFWLAESLRLHGDSEASGHEFEAVVETLPEDFRAWIGLTMARLDLRDSDGASQALDHARQVAPDDTATQIGLAELYRAAGRQAEAKDLILRLHAERDGSGLPCSQLAWSLFEFEAYAEAQSIAEDCVAADPHDGQAHHLLGLSFARQGHYTDARAHLELAADLISGEFPDQEMLDYVRQQLAASD